MSSDGSRERRASVLALVPLGVIALGLFAPPVVRTPPGVHPISPWEDDVSLLWAFPLAAAALAVVTALAAWRRGAPTTASAAVATLGIVACAAPAIVWLRLTTSELGAYRGQWIGFAACVAASAVVAAIAWRATAWQRWILLLGAFALGAAPFGCPLFAGLWNRFSGGYTFIAADATLAVLAARAVIRDH